MQRNDLIGIVEAVYADVDDEGEWLDGILAALRGSFDRGFGVAFAMLQQDARGDVSVTGGRFLDARFVAAAATMLSELTPDTLRQLNLPAVHATTIKEIMGTARDSAGRATWDVFRQHAEPLGISDGIAVICMHGDPRGCALYAGAPAPVRLGRAERLRLDRIGVHLASAVRLRAAREAPADAVLDPDGRILHAIGEASSPTSRAALREAAMRAERARGRLRREDPDDALALWRGLAAGEWSLVDTFERDGKRFYVGRRNPPRGIRAPGLSEREACIVGMAARGFANKLIGYALGLAPSVVSFHLATAASKLGVSNRISLVHLASALLATREAS